MIKMIRSCSNCANQSEKRCKFFSNKYRQRCDDYEEITVWVGGGNGRAVSKSDFEEMLRKQKANRTR
jgi:hypothetical protein